MRDRIFVNLLAPALIGALTGLCVAALVGCIEGWVLNSIGGLPGITPALLAPVALVLTWLAARSVTRVEKPSTSELYITLYREAEPRVPATQLPGRILATTATVGLGGAQGFESTSALIGAAWSDRVARIRGTQVPASVRKSLFAAGASAGIAAVFSSPAAGALYGIEVPYKRDVDAPRLVPCVVAAVCSYATRTWVIGSQRIVELQGVPTVDLGFLLGCLLVAVLCGLGAKLFASAETLLRAISSRQSQMSRAVTGGLMLTLLAIAGYHLTGSWITFGSGYVATGWLQAEPRPADWIVLALLVRAAGNLVTVYGGGGGGVFTSLACNGAFIGEAVARTLRCDNTHTLALFGAACFLGAGYRLPIACMLFVVESGISPIASALGLLAVAIATAVMGDSSVSDAQLEQRDSTG